jgi:hypothetical protein
MARVGPQRHLNEININISSAHVECANKSDTGNNWVNWNRFKITQTIPEQHTGKHGIKELQKTAILCTAHLLWEVLV